MSSSPNHWLLATALAVMAGGALAQSYPNVGRAATAKEVQAWDIDVRPDFKGLPAGSGSVSKGMQVWEAKCASCHGIFGESNEVFFPLVGGTTQEDIKSGRVARLTDPSYPGRTTLMKVSTVSTLWDYINRAMPWAQPKSLSVEEVYGVTAYLLHMGGVLPEGFVLSERNIAQVQALLPNRHGKSTAHGLWPGRGMGNGGKPDVQGSACMTACAAEASVASFLPEHARNVHGNLAEQNRTVGAQHGADTSQAARSASGSNGGGGGASPTPSPPPAAAAKPATGPNPSALLNKHSCSACHGIDKAIVGPGFQAIAKKHAARGDLEAYLRQKIMAGSQGVWGAIPMPPQALPDADATEIARWIASGAKR